MDSVTCTTRPRVGLLGNPSDGYGGRVLSFTFDDFGCLVRLDPGRDAGVMGADGTRVDRPSWGRFVAEVEPRRLSAGADLLAAAVSVFAEIADRPGFDGLPGGTLSFETDIPRQVGLSGSSAIVVGALRVLEAWSGVAFDATTRARMAWRAETHVLGIAAGPQDRVVQSWGGLLDMDFGVDPWMITRLSASSLPPMMLAWTRAPGASSGGVHDDVRSRFDAGEADVVAAMSAFPEFARLGSACLAAGDHDGFRALVDRNFDQRASIWTLAPEDLEMVEIGRASGAAVKFCGSGGAVVIVPESAADLGRLERDYEEAGYATLRPTVTPPLSAGGQTA